MNQMKQLSIGNKTYEVVDAAARQSLEEKLPSDGTAADSAKLGGKAPEYYIQPRNLLDNSDFTNPVNQRGAASYTTNGTYIDRWYLWSENGDATLTIESDGIVVTPNASAHVVLGQRFAKGVLDETKTYTLACMNEDGTIKISHAITRNQSTEYDAVKIVNTAETKIKWAALYEGKYTSETLPPYVSRGNEIGACREYYRQYGDDGIYGYCYVNNYLSGFAFDTPMRTAPTLTECKMMRLSDFASVEAGSSHVVTKRGVDYFHCPGAVVGEWYRITKLTLDANL